MKLYVLVRKDISKSQQAVQAGHAIAQWLLHSPDSNKWKNGTLVYLGVDNPYKLYKIIHKLNTENKHYITFKEPDMDFQITSIARLSNGTEFKNEKLLYL
jgi:peptidyl-tRNA hydrolase